MTTQTPTSAPASFIALLRDAIDHSGMSLREVGRQAGISHAFLSRMLNGERGVPADKTIAKLEKVLNIQPPQRLLYEAGRLDFATKAVLNKEGAHLLIRTLAPLTEDDIKQLQKVAERLARKYHPEKK